MACRRKRLGSARIVEDVGVRRYRTKDPMDGESGRFWTMMNTVPEIATAKNRVAIVKSAKTKTVRLTKADFFKSQSQADTFQATYLLGKDMP